MSGALARRAPGHDVQVVGFVSEYIADFAKANNGGVDAARVLALPEKRLVHADNPKHHAGGIALTLAEYQALPQVVATPDAVYWVRSTHPTLALSRSVQRPKGARVSAMLEREVRIDEYASAFIIS